MKQEIKPCRVCRALVSEYADACPNCGDKTAIRYGHAKPERSGVGGKVALVIAGLFVLGAYFRPEAEVGTAEASAPVHQVQVISVECTSVADRDLAEITVKNTGSEPIEFTKVFVTFNGSDGSVLSAQDSYFSPHTIPAGSTASATVYSSGGGAESCTPTTIQDRNDATVAMAL